MSIAGLCRQAPVVVFVLAWAGVASAQTLEDDEVDVGWANETELSFVLTGGNSSTQTFGLNNTLRHGWETARLQVKVTGVRSDTSDDRFLLVEPGLIFPVGGVPAGGSTTVIKPEARPDVENYLVAGRFDKDISENFFWNAGGSWDRNSDAGIINRYTAFAGLGNTWVRGEQLQFATTYGISVTDREEVSPDPDKDSRFAGARLGWDYLNRFGSTTVYENDLTVNMNLAAPSDYSFTMVNALGVTMNEHLALRVSLQWLYENEPALEGVDVVGRVETVDPDGIPGSGDEFFRTVALGGGEIVVGTGQVRKDRLDSIFRTALVVSF